MKTKKQKKQTQGMEKQSCQAYFYNHPVIHMIYLFCVFFTTYTIVNDIGVFIFKWPVGNRLAYYLFAVIISAIFFFITRPGMKKKLSPDK
ncbi:MAG: hypothetical protein GY749_36435 [Desulfobacteraceae bacterium]|nr:hypothetical protein [Desulfobacteraceae bacterium]